MRLFPKFKDLDLNNLDKNKRLVAHATKVIDTITTVVNLLGDEDKQDILNEALQSTAISHIRRHIGLDKFKNLGIILIDFMCQINHRYQGEIKQRSQQCLIKRNSLINLKNNVNRQQQQQQQKDAGLNDLVFVSDDDDDDYDTSKNLQNDNSDFVNNNEQPSSHEKPKNKFNGSLKKDLNELQQKMKQTSLDGRGDVARLKQNGQQDHQQQRIKSSSYNDDNILMVDVLGNSTPVSVGDITLSQYYKYNIDTNHLVAAWTKLYSSILDIVQSETDKYDKLPKSDSNEEEDLSNASSQYNPSSSSPLEDDSIRPF